MFASLDTTYLFQFSFAHSFYQIKFESGHHQLIPCFPLHIVWCIRFWPSTYQNFIFPKKKETKNIDTPNPHPKNNRARERERETESEPLPMDSQNTLPINKLKMGVIPRQDWEFRG